MLVFERRLAELSGWLAEGVKVHSYCCRSEGMQCWSKFQKAAEILTVSKNTLHSLCFIRTRDVSSPWPQHITQEECANTNETTWRCLCINERPVWWMLDDLFVWSALRGSKSISNAISHVSLVCVEVILLADESESGVTSNAFSYSYT